MPVSIELPDQFAPPLTDTSLLPFFISLIRKHFSTDPSNRFIPALQDLVYNPDNPHQSTINIEPYAGIYYLMGGLPTVYLQQNKQTLPVIGLTDKTGPLITDLGNYWRSNIWEVIIHVLSPFNVNTEHILSEIYYLLHSAINNFYSQLNIHFWQIPTITPLKFVGRQESMAGLSFFVGQLQVVTGLTDAWKIML
jgi:hypothetical protein